MKGKWACQPAFAAHIRKRGIDIVFNFKQEVNLQARTVTSSVSRFERR